MRTNNINVNGENLSYLDSEKGDTTLLFIHGAFISKEYWNDQLSYFAPNYRIVAIDLAGHGNSTHRRTDWTVQNYGKDISEFIKKLSLENVILIGHSFGADVMLETVTSNPSPIKGLIDIDQFKNVGVKLPQKNIDQLVESLKADFTNTCQQYAKEALLTEKTNPEFVTKLLTDYREMKPEVGIPLLKNTFSYAQRETKLLKGLQLKLYLLHVNYSPTNEATLKKYVGNNYELYTISATCHYPMLENPNEFNTSLGKILLEIEKD
jgi:pimeloyl-ACP methyl ester carboxylesterase